MVAPRAVIGPDPGHGVTRPGEDVVDPGQGRDAGLVWVQVMSKAFPRAAAPSVSAGVEDGPKPSVAPGGVEVTGDQQVGWSAGPQQAPDGGNSPLPLRERRRERGNGMTTQSGWGPDGKLDDGLDDEGTAIQIDDVSVR